MLASGPVLGVLAGWASGGRIARLADLHIRWWALLVLAVGLRLLAGVLTEMSAVLYLLGFVGVAAVALLNGRLPGMGVAAAGALLNLAVVAANGAMPVDPAAVDAAGAHMTGDRLHAEMTSATVLSALGDRIPVPPVRGVYSAGDVLLVIGGFWVPFRRMRSA